MRLTDEYGSTINVEFGSDDVLHYVTLKVTLTENELPEKNRLVCFEGKIGYFQNSWYAFNKEEKDFYSVPAPKYWFYVPSGHLEHLNNLCSNRISKENYEKWSTEK